MAKDRIDRDKTPSRIALAPSPFLLTGLEIKQASATAVSGGVRLEGIGNGVVLESINHHRVPTPVLLAERNLG